MEKKRNKGSKISDRLKGKDKAPPRKEKKREISKNIPENLEIKDDVKINETERKEEKGIERVPIKEEKDVTSEEKPETRMEERRIKIEEISGKEADVELKEEADEIAEKKQETVGPEEGLEELLSFYLGDEEYAIDIMIINEIINMTNITYVPRTDEHIRGIISLRGAIVPIFDIKKRLGLNEVIDGSLLNKSRIIVISVDDEMIGIIVDGVAEVVKIRGLDIEPTPYTISGIDAEYIRGVCRYKGRIVILLNILRLFKLQEGKSLG